MIQISSTGLPEADRARLENSARALGGKYAGDLTDRTTHLVATKIHPRSAKLACALKLGLPIVLPQWVYASGAAGEPLPLGPHHVPPALSGVVLAVGGHHRLAEADARAGGGRPGAMPADMLVLARRDGGDGGSGGDGGHCEHS